VTARRTAVYVAIWLLLTAYDVAVDRGARPGAPAPMPGHGALLDFNRADVIGIDLESGRRRVRALDAGDRWRVVEPEENAPPGDLITAMVAAVTEARDLEIADADGTHARELGVDGSSRRITLKRRDGSSTTIVLGSRSPSQTAVYAQREGAREIVLLGLDVQYYFDLVMESVGGRQSAVGSRQ